ncbi:hypothetical protein P8452_31982 [Trifolium repens]|nr:hypothetical protein P8452_31982 [Trifolium repens]
MSLMLAMAKGGIRIGLFREALVDSVMVTDWFQDSLKEDAKQAPGRIKMQVRGNGDGEEDGEKGRLTLSNVNCVKRCNIHKGDNC